MHTLGGPSSNFKDFTSFRKPANNAPRNAKGSGGNGSQGPSMRDVKDVKGKKSEGEGSKPRIVDTAEGRNERWNQMKKSGEWEHYNGPYSQPTLRNRKNGNLAQKSIEKWEIEVFDENEKHIGVIKPSDGKFHPEMKVAGRKIR